MPEPPTTRATLLVRIRDANDAEAWQQFTELYGPVIYGLYRKRGLQDADAADLTQDVLQAVSAGAKRFDYAPEQGTFRGWLFTIARNKLNDFLARRRRHPQGNGHTSTLDLIAAAPADSDETTAWERGYEQQLFALAAEKVRTVVDETTWLAFWRTAVEGKPGREVAESLGMSVGAVYVAKSRVLARLKQQTEKLRGDE